MNANVTEKSEKDVTLDKLISGDIYQTVDFESVNLLCNRAVMHNFMIGLIGDTGLGKSTSLDVYCSTHSNVYKVTVDKAMNAKQFCARILKTIGIDFQGSTHDIVLKIAETLNSKRNTLLIIDEAGKMNHAMMLYMHDIREYTKDNCGIILAGMPYFKANLQKFSDRQKEGCSEFLRRINLWHTLKGLTRDEIIYICHKEGIEDETRIKELCRFRRFGDLMNEILLDKITNIKYN